ncbi:hypothetical protein L484_017426 [Morus notabilis]|uniref:Uncharacterized protein n=1 Tax=Morus notabilis TaxID=981085 RepID=W9QW28_9ROSA|nr:hypothetical protein L484_017426 [Morus notabilis]
MDKISSEKWRGDHMQEHEANLPTGKIRAVLVQVHNLPLDGMYEKISNVIGDSIVVYEKVEADDNGRSRGKYTKIRVLNDVSKPLVRGVPDRLGEGKKLVLIYLKYEEVPDFCYVCRIIGHYHYDCHDEKAETIIKRFPCGPFLFGHGNSSDIRTARNWGLGVMKSLLGLLEVCLREVEACWDRGSASNRIFSVMRSGRLRLLLQLH